MKVTVCELRDGHDELAQDWDGLAAHVRGEAPDLVLLPEMPFHPWLAWTNESDPAVWRSSVASHDQWVARLTELAPALVMGSRPVIQAGKQLNEGFIWDAHDGYRGVHHKYYLPDEEEFWEASWYEKGNGEFRPVETPVGKIGVLICTEMWFTAHAIDFAKEGVSILASPRATAIYSVDKWKAGGRTASVMSGAYCLSSNRGGFDEQGQEWGGNGWIIEPEEGRILGLTSQEHPFLTMEIDLQVAAEAKRSYPRYIYA
jgi:N-carbamoylputrescine amidase